MPTDGLKLDRGKARLDLIPPRPLLAIAAVLGFGAVKYGEGNWMHVVGAEQRYYAAAMRHLLAWQDGERLDPESGLPHLAHAACSIIFMLWFEMEARDVSR